MESPEPDDMESMEKAFQEAPINLRVLTPKTMAGKPL